MGGFDAIALTVVRSGRYLVGIGRQFFRQLVFGPHLGHNVFALDNDRGQGSRRVTGVISVRASAIAGAVSLGLSLGLSIGLSLGFVGASSAKPLYSSRTVYIGGLPCNVPCQSYMAWSRRTLRANQAAARSVAHTFAVKASGDAARKRVSKHVEPASADALSRKKNDLQAVLTPTPELPLPRPRTETAPLNVEPRDPATAPPTASDPPPVPSSGTENAPLTTETVPPARERTPQELVMAALAVAEQITNAETPTASNDDRTEQTKTGDANASAPKDGGALVALLISRPDVKSASALKGLNVAIDTAQSAVVQDIRFALAAAGATEVELSVSDVSPLDRLAGGDVQAAVVKLVSPDAAEAFPDIKGFKVLRVSLSPR
jgi:hypothetical protein